MRLPALPLHLLAVVSLALTSTACGQNTDTSVSETATTVTTGSTGPTSPGTGGDTGSGGLTGGLTGTGGDDASASGTTSGATGGGSTGPEPGTESGATLESTTLTTGEPQTTGASTGLGESTGETAGETTGGDTTNGQIDDCQELKAAFASETQEIRSCMAAEQCGQELGGTSCGCTHNWVARTDADTDHFYELLGMADRLGCELILAGICNCPAADGFTCTDGICTWNYL